MAEPDNSLNLKYERVLVKNVHFAAFTSGGDDRLRAKSR